MFSLLGTKRHRPDWRQAKSIVWDRVEITVSLIIILFFWKSRVIIQKEECRISFFTEVIVKGAVLAKWRWSPTGAETWYKRPKGWPWLWEDLFSVHMCLTGWVSSWSYCSTEGYPLVLSLGLHCGEDCDSGYTNDVTCPSIVNHWLLNICFLCDSFCCSCKTGVPVLKGFMIYLERKLNWSTD